MPTYYVREPSGLLVMLKIKMLQSVVNAAVRFVYEAGKRVPARQLLICRHTFYLLGII